MTPQEGTPVPEREDLEKEATLVGMDFETWLGEPADSARPNPILVYGKAQRERGRLSNEGSKLAANLYAKGLETIIEQDTALLREALEWIESVTDEPCGEASCKDCGRPPIYSKLKARLSPKESGGQGRAGG